MYSFSLGDSRIYLYRDGELNQISQDHTLAMRKYLANIYTKEEAEQSSDSHKLTLFLGVDINNNGLVAEKYLLTDCTTVVINNKKYLSPDYVVHHKDENRLNNNVDNLEIMIRGNHTSMHNKENPHPRDALGRFI